MRTPFFTVEYECPEDFLSIEAMLDLSLGADRFSKSSYALRDGVTPVAPLSLVLRHDQTLCGSIRFWPVIIGASASGLLLGPLGVHPDYQGHGGGLILMNAGLAKAKQLGHKLVFLVGDLAYYRKAGFACIPEGQISLAGNPDAKRLLFNELEAGALTGVRGQMRKYQ